MKNIHVHIDSKHPEHDKKTFVCNHCPRSFIFEASLKKHLENQRTMAKNRAKKISLGLMQRNRRKKYGDHYLNQPDNPTNDIHTKTKETGTYIILLIEQVAAVFYLNKQRYLTFENLKDSLQFTEPFKFELQPRATQC